MAHNWTYYYTRLGHADHIQKIYMYLKTGSSFTLSHLYLYLTQRFLQQETNVTDSEWCTFGILLSTCTVHISLVWSNVIIKPGHYQNIIIDQ